MKAANDFMNVDTRHAAYVTNMIILASLVGSSVVTCLILWGLS